MKTFNVPVTYRSPLITAIKNRRRQQDKMKKDFTPALLDLGGLRIYLARHFGFCYGVENAIEISFRTVDENPGKRIFLLSEMIHNPRVNADLQSRGVQFLQDTHGNELTPLSTLSSEDIVIIPAFGATLEMEEKLQKAGIRTSTYNTTCPFVEKVWNRSEQIAKKNYTVIVHGKPGHEETRATFSHAASHTPTLVVKDMQEAVMLGEYIRGTLPASQFYDSFKGRYSAGFDPGKDLERIGVVNQTTMLASDTQEIADFLKQTMMEAHKQDPSDRKQDLSEGKQDLSEKRQNLSDKQNADANNPSENVEERFADTRDTLCYATLDNQTAVTGMLEAGAAEADVAIVVGGYNSSNTSHLVELCEKELPTYFISSDEKILSREEILHYNFHTHEELLTRDYLPSASPAETENPIPTKILLTSGASCPDSMVEGVIRKLAGYFPGALEKLEQMTADIA